MPSAREQGSTLDQSRYLGTGSQKNYIRLCIFIDDIGTLSPLAKPLDSGFP